jgi:hypothetical protein
MYRLKKSRPDLKSSLVLLALVGTLPGFTSELVSSFFNLPVDFLASTIIGPALPAILIVSAVYGLITRDKEFALSAARSIRQGEANDFGIDAISIKSRELSEYLHNTLQSELLRISKQLERTNNPELTASYIDQLNLALNRTRADVEDLKVQGIERLTAVCQAWDGIASIHLTSHEIDAVGDQKISAISGLIEEIISNSIRYGDASKISIDIRGPGPQLDILITHNGSKDLSNGNGLGSLSFISKTTQTPTFRATREGMTLKFTL